MWVIVGTNSSDLSDISAYGPFSSETEVEAQQEFLAGEEYGDIAFTVTEVLPISNLLDFEE